MASSEYKGSTRRYVLQMLLGSLNCFFSVMLWDTLPAERPVLCSELFLLYVWYSVLWLVTTTAIISVTTKIFCRESGSSTISSCNMRSLSKGKSALYVDSAPHESLMKMNPSQ